MKKILTILFILFVGIAKGQVYQTMPQFGYQFKRIKVDSTLHIPSFCGVPTLRNSAEKEGAIAIDTCNNTLYKYTRANGWSAVSGGGGTIDTTSLSNRINAKADTSAVNLKLNISDTTNKWVSSVTKVNDSTIRVVKDVTTTDIAFTTSTNATRLITKVWNSTGATITRGSVVYINGAHSSILPSIALAKANAESTSAYTYGLVVDDISDNSEGTVIQNGAITNLNLPTNTYTDGQTLYLSPTVAGGYTLTKPLAPNHYVAIGTITRAHPVFGTIQVAIRNGFQLDEMSDVSIASVPADSTLLQFSRVDSLWHDVSVTNAIGTKYIKPSDTASMLTNYGRKNYNTLSVVLNNGNTATDKILQLTASTTQSGYMTTKTSSARGSLFNNRLSIEDLSGNSNYTYLDIDTSTNDPYLMIHQNSSLKECRVYSDNFAFKNLSNGSIVTINAPNSSSNRTINFQDKSYTIADSADVALKTNLSQSSYTFLANNTNATANMTSQTFNDQGSQTYTGTITWGSANPPTGTTNHSYRWTQIGKMVTLSIQLVYGTASTGTQTSVTMTLPTGLPSPNIPSGLASGDVVYHGTGSIYNTSNTMPTTTSFVVGMFSDGTIRINRISAGTSRYASATVTYWTN